MGKLKGLGDDGDPSTSQRPSGMHQLVEQIRMGKVVPVGDSGALTETTIRVVRNREGYAQPRENIEER